MVQQQNRGTRASTACSTRAGDPGIRGGLAALALAACLAAEVDPVYAQEPGSVSALADALFRDGKRLMGESRFAEACAKFTESQRLDPASGTLLALATCHEKQGKIATAWAMYREVLPEAERAGRVDRVTFVKERLAALGGQVSTLRIDVAAATLRHPGARVLFDGVEIREGTIGVPVPVDPGAHVVAVEGGGAIRWRHDLLVTTVQQELRVEVPAVAIPAPAPPTTWSRRRSYGLALGLVGVASLGTGTYFGIKTMQTQSQVDKLCPDPSSCANDEAFVLNDSAARTARLTDVTLGLGAVCVAVGAWLLFFPRKAASDAGQARASGGGLGVELAPAMARVHWSAAW